MNAAVLACVALAAALPAAYAQTVPLEGSDLDIAYGGDGIVVESAVLDDIGSVELEVSADDDSTLRVTIPAGVFGSADPSRVDVLVDFAGAQFRADASDSGLEVSVQVDVATRTIQILYDDSADDSAAELPDPQPEPAAPPEPAPAAPAQPAPPRPEPAAPAQPAPPQPEPAAPAQPAPPQPEPAAPAQPAAPPLTDGAEERGESGVRCGEGTYLKDGACVPSCGAGLVLKGDVCVVERAPASAQPANTRTDLVYGAAAGFAVAFAVMLLLWIMARASRRQQP